MDDTESRQSTHSLTYLETKDDVTTLVEISNDSYDLRLDMCHYGLELRGFIYPRTSGKIIDSEFVKSLISQNAIKGFVSQKHVEGLCIMANQGRQCENLILVRGIYPVEGDDERMHFFVKPKSNKPHVHSHGVASESIGSIETNTFFDNVSKGEAIAEKSPPEEGIAGVAVNGEPIPPINGRLLTSSPRAGNNVCFDKKTRRFYAEVDGCVIYNEEQGLISVEDKLVIADDVDFIVGHIDFVGEVEIHGDVMNELHVKAGKNITVTGHVGNCCLDAVGDIVIRGMTGLGHASIRCGGVLRAKYLDGVHAEVLGDVFIANEVIDSDILTARAIHCPAGRIIGGNCMALTGIEVSEIGSESNIPTKMIVGRSFIALKLINILDHKITRSVQRLKKIIPITRPYIHDPDKLKRLDRKKRKEMETLIDEERQLILLRKESEAMLEQERPKVTEGAHPIISAGQGVWAGARVSFGVTTEIITEAIHYPTSIIEDMETGHYKLVRHVSINTDLNKLRPSKKKKRK